MADERPQYQHGIGTIGGQQFHWGSGSPDQYWSIPYGDYPVTPNAPTGAWAHQVGAIPIANNVIPDPLLGRNRIGIMIHSGSASSLDALYTQGCFKVAPQEWPAVRSEILKEADNGPLYLHVAPGGVAAFTNTKTFSQAGDETPAANANTAANTSAGTPDFYNTAMMHESGGKNIPNAAGGAAAGYYQFTPPTWATIRAARPDLNLPPNVMAATPDQQTAAYHELAKENVTALQGAGLPINDKNAFMASFLGGGGASKFLNQMGQNPNASAADLFPNEAKANPTIFYNNGKPRSLNDVFALETAKFGTGNTTGFGPNSTPGTTLNSAPAAPAGGPGGPAAPGAAPTGLAGSLPGFQPDSPGAKMTAKGLDQLAGKSKGGSGGDDQPMPPMPQMQLPQPMVSGAPMMLGAGGQNSFGQRAAQQYLAQQGFSLQPSVATGVAPNVQPTPQMMPAGQATGIPSLPGTTLNSPSQLQMALITGQMSPYDIYAQQQAAGGGGSNYYG